MPSKGHDFFLIFIRPNIGWKSPINTKSGHIMYPLNGFTTA